MTMTSRGMKLKVGVFVGWFVRVYPVCMLQHLLPELLVEPGQVPRPGRPHAGLQVCNPSPLATAAMATV